MTGTSFCDVAFSRDGAILASVQGETGLVEIRDPGSGEVLHKIDDFPACFPFDGGSPHGLSFSAELLAIGGAEGQGQRARSAAAFDQAWLRSGHYNGSDKKQQILELPLPNV